MVKALRFGSIPKDDLFGQVQERLFFLKTII